MIKFPLTKQQQANLHICLAIAGTAIAVLGSINYYNNYKITAKLLKGGKK